MRTKFVRPAKCQLLAGDYVKSVACGSDHTSGIAGPPEDASSLVADYGVCGRRVGVVGHCASHTGVAS